MKKLTENELTQKGRKIVNARITNVDLDMSDYGCLRFCMNITGNLACCYGGGYCIGKGYLDCDDNYFQGSANGMEMIMRIMDVVGVSKFDDMDGKYVRVVDPGVGQVLSIIGNIIEDKWFDMEEFWEEKNG